MKCAVLVIDVINDFVTGVLGSERAASIIPGLSRLLNYVRGSDVPLIFVSDSHTPEVDSQFELWPKHAEEGSYGAEIVEDVKPEKEDFQIFKRRYSGFYDTNLDTLLKELRVDSLILTGLVTNICIQHTAADAFFHGYRLIILKDCVEAPSEKAQNESLKYMENMYGAKIVTSKEMMEKGLMEVIEI